MVVWCNNCQKYVNQICDRCGDSFGELYCEKYGCGGRMMCPICHGYDLETVAEHRKKEQQKVDPYDYATQRKMGISSQEQEQQVNVTQTMKCMSCGFPIDPSWNFCPNCGINLRLKLK